MDSCRKGCRRVKAGSGAGPEEPLAFDLQTVALADRVLTTVEVAAWAVDVMEKHHFTTPGLMSVLNQARLRSGVLAPAQFAFLKLVDRRLWYALHALGFESDALIAHPHPSMRVEAIGAGAHWAAERAVGVPIPTPEFDEAIAAIRPKDGLNESRFLFAPLVRMLALRPALRGRRPSGLARAKEKDMLVEDRASVEAVLDERDPSRLRIDIRLHPMSVGALNPDASEIQRAIREGFRDALREAQLERLAVASNPQPKRRGWFARVLGFVVCVGLGAMATLVLTAYHPRPSAVAGLDDLGSPVATPGSQSNPIPAPSEPAPPNRPLPQARPRASRVPGHLACISNKGGPMTGSTGRR